MVRNGAEPGRDLLLAIDQGGHATRAIAFDYGGKVRAQAFADIETLHPRPDWVEHDPRALLASAHVAVAELAEALGGDCTRLRRAGLATQRSSIVCWDRTGGEPLSNVISWQDRRAARWLAQFEPAAERIHRITGLVLSPHYGASKLRWCLDRLPAVAAAGERLAIGPLASYLLHRLLPERPLLADPANASRTLLWDYQRRDWSPELLDLFDIPRAPLPRCAPSRARYGTLPVGETQVPLEICTGDQPAALYALGEPAADAVYANLGTGAFLQRSVGDHPVAAPGLLSSVVYQGRHQANYVLEGTVNGAGSALAEVAAQLGFSSETVHRMSAEWLERDAEPPLFLNGVSGLGSPYWIAEFPSRFIGPGEDWQRMVAVLESIVFLLAVNLEALADHTSRPRRLVLTGGLAAVDPLCQRLADLTALAVVRPSVTEATARGLAFLLAGRPERWPPTAPETRFTARANKPLAARYQRWRASLATALEDIG